MAELVVTGLTAGVEGRTIVHDIDLTVRSGEVHVIMGPNGSGKSTISHVLAGRPGYEVLAGSVRIDGEELLDLPAWERARHGLFLAQQNPSEVPGVPIVAMLAAATDQGEAAESEIRAATEREAAKIGLDLRLLDRGVNVDMSGGEKKRSETLQLAVLDRRFAILDEIDSGLDVDGLRLVARRVAELVAGGLGVLVITHFTRLLDELPADRVYVLVGGRIVATGGPEVAAGLETTGYSGWVTEPTAVATHSVTDPYADPFA